jgi:hypothetical protein
MKGPKKTASSSQSVGRKSGQRPDWRGEALDRIRRLIQEADPEAVEEQKWKKPSNPRGIPVWYHAGIICTGETYKDHLRLTFADGAAIEDPTGLFNANLRGVTRAIVLYEGDRIDATAFKALVRAAAAQNASSARK